MGGASNWLAPPLFNKRTTYYGKAPAKAGHNNKHMYFKKIKFKDKLFDIKIKTKDDGGYDLEIGTTARLSGDEFQALRNYLEEEGFIEQAKAWSNN
jgi:hypothetical protein